MILRLVLGVLLVVMALGQLFSFGTMPDILSSYGVTGGAASTALAVALIAAESVGGVWFLVRPRSTALTPVWIYTGVSVLWAALAVQAYARGLDLDNCGYFGVYLSQQLRWFVLVEDALMLLYAAVLLRGARRHQADVQESAPPGKHHRPSLRTGR
ncbi:hypothetical protein N566_08250 [Streptomycetaceae bacterium MP113-05]|nr:hypothetical protein N566_08250 [Streptomycetaceae bacterium MP113-05]